MENLEAEIASELGIVLETERKLFSEKRYLVIIEVIKDKKRIVGTNVTPISNLQEAIEISYDKIKHRITENDSLTYRVMELVFADVPIETLLGGEQYEVQPITSRWLSIDELKQLINYESQIIREHLSTIGDSIEETRTS